VTALPRATLLSPFQVRSFRFQWPADLSASWALEMETIILGWYVLVETQSVVMLTVFASLQYIGTLLSPMLGVIGDRFGQRTLLCGMRSVYAVCALTLMTSTFLGLLSPMLVLAIAFVVGLVRPSDNGMRSALVAEIMPPDKLVGAMGLQRTTQDSARVAGALTGASLVALLGMGPAYIVVSLFYLTSIGLMLRAGGVRFSSRTSGPADTAAHALAVAAPSYFSSLKEGLVYTWNTPHLRAAMLLALMLNLTAFPLCFGLMPVVAKDVYNADQTTLGYLVAAFSAGAVIGSLIVSRFAHRAPPARMMIVFSVAWYLMLIVFAQTSTPAMGIPVLVVTGIAQALGLVAAVAMLMRHSHDAFRGRIMGIRMMAIYGNLPGLLLSGPLIAQLGYPAMATLYCSVGIVVTLVIAVVWRAVLWRADAPANQR